MAERSIRLGLWAGIAVPLVYYGVQLAVLPGYPDYDVARQVASELGAPPSRAAGLFNAGILAVGVLTLIGAASQFAAMRRQGAGLPLAGAAAIGMACFGAATIVAGLYPLPDPRHASGSPLLVGAMAYPVLMAAVMWRRPRWRGAFLACAVLVGISALVMGGVITVDRARWAGAIQRPMALTLLGPMALASWALMRRW